MAKKKKAQPKKSAVKKSKVAKKTVKKTAAKAKPSKAKAKAKPKKSVKAAKAVQTSTQPKFQAKLQLVKMDWGHFMTPLDDRLVVEVSSAEKRTAGGLYIPETSSAEGHFEGKVVLVGRGHRDKKGRVRPMDVKVGDVVLFSQFSGSKLDVNHALDARILRESEVLGIKDAGK